MRSSVPFMMNDEMMILLMQQTTQIMQIFFCRITVTHNIDNKKENHDEVMNALGDINLTHSVSSIRVIVEVIKTSYFIFIFSRFYLFYK